MQILARQTVQSLLTMPMAIEAIEELLKTQAHHPKWIKCPERLVIPTFNESENHRIGSHLSMPSVVYDGTQEFTVVKLVTICPDNPDRNLPTTTAVISVSDNATGEILAFMDGIYITQVRTAALSGIATKHLASHDSQRVAVIGCGDMAYEQLNAVLTVRPNITHVNLWNRTRASAESFKSKFQREYPQWSVQLTVCDDIASAVANADIINLATRSEQGLFDSPQIKPRVHINAVGAYLPTMKEVSNEVIAASSHVFIDDIAGGRHEAGDLIQAHNDSKCQWCWDDLRGDLKALSTGDFQINQSSAGITLFKSVGAASYDAAVALKVAQLAQSKSLGQTIKW